MSATRGKSNINTRYTKQLAPENIETDGIKVGIYTDYTPSPERLEREAHEKLENERESKKCHTKRGILKDSSSDIWDKLDDDVEYIDKTDWSKPKSVIKHDKNTNESDTKSGELNKDEVESCFWDKLGDDVEYMGETDWSEFKKKAKFGKKEVTDNKKDSDKIKTDKKAKTKVRHAGKSKSASSFSIKKCKKCMLDCEYSAFLRGESTGRSFKIKKSTCPKQ